MKNLDFVRFFSHRITMNYLLNKTIKVVVIAEDTNMIMFVVMLSIKYLVFDEIKKSIKQLKLVH